MKKLALVAMICLGLFSLDAGAKVHKHPKKKTYHTKKYKKHSKGLTRSTTHRMRATPHVSYLGVDTPIPGHVDLSSQVSLPENQGQCGCCWDFSLTKALRSEYMIAKRDPGVLDFNYLLDNCGPGPKMGGCNGGDFVAASSFLLGSGPGLDRDDHFTGKPGKCKKVTPQATAASYSMLGEGENGPNFKDIAYAVGIEHHMLSIDVAAGSGEWESYSDGIYNDCQGDAENIDHMINLVGYDCETSVDANLTCLFDANGKPVNGDGYLIVENNWGEDWGTKAGNGHGGYMKTRMYNQEGTHCNAIANDALMFNIVPPEIASQQIIP